MAKLNFKKLGVGEPLIILHGLYGCSDNWITIARELMRDCSVYLIDLRNHGLSPHLPEHNYQVITDDLAEFMNDQDIYSAHLLGHSMGGKAAMFFTALYPERVRKLIVVDISPRTYKLESGDNQVNDHMHIIKSLESINVSELSSRNDAERILATKIHSARIRQFLLKNLRREKDNSFVWKINLAALENNLPRILSGLEEEQENLILFKNKTLFIKGEDSDYIKDADKELIMLFFKNVQIETIEKASHWVHAEQPELFIKIVSKFLAS